MKAWKCVAALLTFLAPAMESSAASSEGREWIETISGHSAAWKHQGALELPSGKIFIGDPSWGDGHHLRGAKAVPVNTLDVWLLVSRQEEKKKNQVHAVWLAAADTKPSAITRSIEFGVDSAYFALGDLSTGQSLATIGDQGLPEIPDSFEFFLPHIQDSGFLAIWLDVPPTDQPVLAVETKRDGGLKAVWTENRNERFSGILIDITGRASDRRYLDTLIGP
jgi:hypothetical protein